MKIYKLDKTIEVDKEYVAEMDKAYLIEEIGTSSTSKASLIVAGAPCVEIVQDIAPLYPEVKNLNSLLKLDKLFIVIPPSKRFRFSGSPGSEMRLKGKIIELEPGEALPAEYLARYTEQSKKYISYQYGSVSAAAGTVISAGAETKIIDFTCPAGEKWVFNSRYQAEGRLDDLTNVNQFYFQIRINDDPLDILSADMGKKGIAGASSPNPPRDLSSLTTDIQAQLVEKTAFTFEDMPIELTPGRNLKVIGINTGGDYTVPTGKTLHQIVHLVGIKEQL